MAEKHEKKYMITKTKPGFVPNFFGPPAKYVKTNEMSFLDDEVIKGGFYTEVVWFIKGSDEIAVHPHTHNYDEVIAFYGSDPDNPEDLGGEIEDWIDGERYLITQSCMLFIPRGIKHGPMIIKRVDRPIFHFATGNTPLYGGSKV